MVARPSKLECTKSFDPNSGKINVQCNSNLTFSSLFEIQTLNLITIEKELSTSFKINISYKNSSFMNFYGLHDRYLMGSVGFSISQDWVNVTIFASAIGIHQQNEYAFKSEIEIIDYKTIVGGIGKNNYHLLTL